MQADIELLKKLLQVIVKNYKSWYSGGKRNHRKTIRAKWTTIRAEMVFFDESRLNW